MNGDQADSPDDTTALRHRAKKSYRSLDGVVVVSPRLIADLVDALEAAEARSNTGTEKSL